MLTVITGWSPQGFTEYAHRFVESFERFWPADVRCIAYVEEAFTHPRIECRLIENIPGCMAFIDKWSHIPIACGRERAAHRWKQREIQNGYSYRFDAVKFCRQAFIPLAAAGELGDGLMCWLDADVLTFKEIPPGFIEGLLPEDADLSYLGRAGNHSEIGFQLYRLPQAQKMLQSFRDLYATDEVFQLPEWHSAYVFDQARRDSGVKGFNLTPGGEGHVWFQSPLGHYLDHCKGDKRKNRGYSAERSQ